MRTVLFVGAGRDQRPAILQAKTLGLRVAAVDDDPEAAGLPEADIAKIVDISDPGAILKATARFKLDGVLTVYAGGAEAVVAAVAEERGLPGIGAATAHVVSHKIALRRRLADAGVPQPRFAAVRLLSERRRAVEGVGFPAVLKPADAGGQRGVFRVESLDDVDAHLHEALAASPAGETLLEEFVEGTEMSAIVLARGGDTMLLTLSDRLRPPGAGFGVGWIQLYPATAYGAQLEEAELVARRVAHVVGLTTGIASVQLISTADGRVAVVGCAAQIPARQTAELVRFAVGVDLVEVQLAMALGDDVPDELVRPRFTQPVAVRFLTAEPGPLPAGRVRRVGPLDKLLAFPGVVQAEVELEPGTVIDPVRLGGDRHGHVIAAGATNLEALERVEAASRLLDVEVE